jgi:hypothetical protein
MKTKREKKKIKKLNCNSKYLKNNKKKKIVEAVR